MKEINRFIYNYATMYAKDMIKYQRIFRCIVYDLNTEINCIENKMQGVRSINLSAVKVRSQKDREHILIEKMEEKEELEKKRKGFSDIIHEFDEHLNVLDSSERKIIENKIEWLEIDYLGIANDLGIDKEEVKKKEASALSKLGYSLMGLNVEQLERID